MDPLLKGADQSASPFLLHFNGFMSLVETIAGANSRQRGFYFLRVTD